MTTNTDPVRALIGKWRQQAQDRRNTPFPEDGGEDLDACAKQLEATLASAPPSGGEVVAWLRPEDIAHLARQNGPAKVEAWNCASGSERLPVYTTPPAILLPSAPVGVEWPAGVLSREQTMKALREHNAWRRGARGPQTDSRLLGLALDAAIAALAQQPAAPSGEQAWPIIGEKYLVWLNGVLQHEIYTFDQGDSEPYSSAPMFWSRDGLDECPLFDPEKDQWLSLSKIKAAIPRQPTDAALAAQQQGGRADG